MRVGVLTDDGAFADLLEDPPALPAAPGLTDLIADARRSGKRLAELIDDARRGARERVAVDLEEGIAVHGTDRIPLAVPVDAPECWAAGVTYLRSREAREEEARPDSRDIYARVYDAQRPEIFLKDAGSRRTVGPGGDICVRRDSTSTVPEPELGLILDTDGRIVAYTVGNDVCARDLEGENPLYLGQAKTYRGSCALGPAALIAEGDEEKDGFPIDLVVRDRDGAPILEAATSTRAMRRGFAELVAYLARDNVIADGTVLLTGTGIVPPDGFTLEEGQTTEIAIPSIGTLRNRVRRAASG